MNAELSLDWLGALALRGAILLAVVLMVGLLFRHLSAGRRYGLWLAALTGLLALPLLLIWGPAWRVLPNLSAELHLPALELSDEIDWEPVVLAEPMPVATKPASVVMPSTAVSSESVELAPVEATPNIDWAALVGWLPMLWLVGVALGLGSLFVTLWRLRRLGDQQCDMQVDLLAEVAQEVGLRRLPRLVMGSDDAVPMVWGVLRPCLLLPTGFQDWPPLKLRAVLLHELAHLARRDPLALWLGQVARVLHWFNPLAWLTLSRMRADQERACDDTVLRHGVRASDYAQVLLDLSQQRRPVAGLSLCALAMARSGPVEQRLVAILDGKCSRASATRGWRLLWITLVLAVALPLAVLHAAESAKARGRIVDRNGVVLAETREDGLRVYPQKELASHVVGYVARRPLVGTLPEDREKLIGRNGIEKSFDETLLKGEEVRLTIDSHLQRQAQDELQASTQNGAMVLIDVSTGEILVLASWPSYDLNLWVPKVEIEEYKKRSADPAKPLFPRATFAQYPPGGPFNLVTALAGLAAVHGNAVFFCEEKLKIGDRYFHNHSKKDVGDFDLERAIARTHNVYFYQLALQLGHQPLAAMAEKLGFGEKTGLPLEAEGAGHFPAFPLTGRRQGSTLSDGEIANLSIGQGTALATTVQMARMAATIASRGKARGPVLVKGAIGKPATELQLREEDWDLLHRAMRCDVPRAVTSSGASTHVNIAMMAGTSQWNVRQKQNLAQVVGFAPMENPQVAFAVVLEGRPEQSMSGGGMAAPMAKRIVERYYGHSIEWDSKLDTSNDVRSTSPHEDWKLVGIHKGAWFFHLATERFNKVDVESTLGELKITEIQPPLFEKQVGFVVGRMPNTIPNEVTFEADTKNAQVAWTQLLDSKELSTWFARKFGEFTVLIEDASGVGTQMPDGSVNLTGPHLLVSEKLKGDSRFFHLHGSFDSNLGPGGKLQIRGPSFASIAKAEELPNLQQMIEVSSSEVSEQDVSATWAIAGIFVQDGKYLVTLKSRVTGATVKVSEDEVTEGMRLIKVDHHRNLNLTSVILKHGGKRFHLKFEGARPSGSVKADGYGGQILRSAIQAVTLPSFKNTQEQSFRPQPIQKPKMDANTESRWRKLQTAFQLPELPNAAHGVKSLLVGSWPRATQLSFSAPRLETLRWLESIQVGHWAIDPFAQQSVGVLAPSLAKIVQESWQQKTQALNFVRDQSGKSHASMILYPVRPFESFGGARLFISETTDNQLRVVITTNGRSSVLIAE